MTDSASKMKGLAWIVVGFILGLIFAYGLAPLAHAIPFGWESKIAYVLGSDFPQEKCTGSLRAQELLKRLLTRIYPIYPDDTSFAIQLRVIGSADVNAYAELGGKISINSGLLAEAESAEEVAGILAHEIEHVHHRHVIQGVLAHLFTAQGLSLIFAGEESSSADWANYFLNMTFSRTQEAQADEAGLTRLQKAHVDNRGFRNFFLRIGKSDATSVFLSDHPTNESRTAMAGKFSNKDITPIMTDADWGILKNFCVK